MLRHLILICLIPSLFITPSFAADPFPFSYEKEEAQIPQIPTAPPPLPRKIPKNYPHCERYFIFRGQRLECDTNYGKDAGRLKLIVQDVPAALQEVEIYEQNREVFKRSAYLASIGIVAALVGSILSHPPIDPTTGKIKIGGFMMFGGVGLALGSFTYAIISKHTNEAHLERAVSLYNAAHPNTPIELQFSTNFNF